MFGEDLALLNVYGSPGLEPNATYDDNATEAPYDPDEIPSDSVTFNPAIIRSDRDEWISQGNPDIDGCFGGNMNLKKHLRLFYTPAHDFEGPRTDADLYDPATQADTINLESTYILTDGDSNEPQPMCNDSTIPFPTVGNDVFIEDDDPADDCHCAFGLNGSQPGVDNMTIVDIKNVEAAGFDGGTWESGQFQIEQQVSLAKGQAVQFLDRVYQYRGLGESGSGDGDTVAFFKTWYAGNTFLDAPQEHAIERSDRTFFDRSSNDYDDSLHGTPANIRTSYLQFDSTPEEDDGSIRVTVGKEIKSNDTYYVDGVRYDVALASTIGSQGPEGDHLNSLTLRTPLPKSAPNGSWTSIPNHQIDRNDRETFLDEQWQADDWSVVTSQWLVEYNVTDPIPVNPPFNQDDYEQVDDTDIQLWEQGDDNDKPNFPWGPNVGPDKGDDPDVSNGLPLFELGHTYLTRELVNADSCDELDLDAILGNPDDKDPSLVEDAMQCAWIDYFDAERTDHEGANGLRDRLEDTGPINHWSLFGGAVQGNNFVNFTYNVEFCQDRFNTNLHEVLEVDDQDRSAWTDFEVNTHPCHYTQFLLPDRPNTVSSLEADLATFHPDPGAGTYNVLGGDYLVNTAFKLQDDETRFAFTHDPLVDFDGVEGLDNVDIYVNPGAGPQGQTDSVRLYGEERSPAPATYDDPEAAYDPTAIPKDSATFNPAIIEHSDEDFTGFSSTFSWIQSCFGDSNLKKHLRTWYQPSHDYEGPRTENGQFDPPSESDVINVESTYSMTDGDSNNPVGMCEHATAFPFPTFGTTDTLDGTLINADNTQPGLDTMTHVSVGDISPDTGATTQGSIELLRQETLRKGEFIQMFDHLLNFTQIVEMGDDDSAAEMSAWYAGNTFFDRPKTFTLGSDRTWVCPSNTQTTEPADTQSCIFVELQFFSESKIRVTVGKEISGGDTFYVDGVRYDVPAVYVADGEGQYITLRTPLPKSDSDPNKDFDGGTECGDWAAMPEEHAEGSADVSSPREETKDPRVPKCQLREWSTVSSQWLWNIDVGDPIPVDPPFNHRFYNMVDDTDVQLWTPTENVDVFPFGEANPSLPDGNGNAKFPLGHTYLTRERPDCQAFAEQDDPPPKDPALKNDAIFCDWIEYFAAEPLNVGKITDRILSGATGINPGTVAWSDEVPDPTAANFLYEAEWCEDRFNTNLDQMLAQTSETATGLTWNKTTFDSEPCEYTEFVLPDRPNPVSATLGNLTGLHGTALGDIPLLGGDYLITSSLMLPEDGSMVSGSGPTFDAFDYNEDCTIQTVPELTDAIEAWLDAPDDDDQEEFNQLFSTATHWLNSPGYC